MTLTLTFHTQNVQLHEIHMHAKYIVAIFNIAKVMANDKVFGPPPRRGRREGYDNTLGLYYFPPTSHL